MLVPVDFVWEDPDRTVIRYRALGVWNWNDFHKVIRISTFQLDRLDHDVDTLFDLTASSRLPAGAVGHLRTLGKADHPRRRPRAIVIGADETLQRQVGAVEGVYAAEDQMLHFVPTDAAARELLLLWQA